jgi:hypothetical protein
MKKAVLLVLMIIVVIPVYSFAQGSGAFVGSFGLGLTSAQGDFAKSDVFAAGGGFGFGAELRYYLFNGFAIGGLANYNRFGSSYTSPLGTTSYTFTQLGGLARLNFASISGGKLYVVGGGGVFTPSVHFYMPNNPTTYKADKAGTFGFGGIGISSMTDRKVIYEVELKYNMARDDYTLDTNTKSNVFDFIYFGLRLSFSSKGKDAPPKY